MPQIHANGIDIEYESFGRTSDPAILLIMGFATQMTAWSDALCEGLAAKGFRVIRFDNRDIGKSTHLAALGAPDIPGLAAGKVAAPPYTLDDMAADAAGLLDALNIADAHVAGASMGGMIAQLVAIHHPRRARSLISIMSTTARRGLPPAKPEALAAILTPPASDSRADRIAAGLRVRKALASPGYPATDAEMIDKIGRAVDRAPYDPAGIARQAAAIMTAQPRNGLLTRVSCPVLVIHGADDPLIPVECGKDTAASIAGSKLVVVPGMGHDFADALTPVYLKHIGDFVSAVEANARPA